MSRYARDFALTPAVMDRLTAFADVDARLLVSDFAKHSDVVARADFLLTGWGSPRVTDAVLEAAPRLRLIAHSAGTVKIHLSDAVWRRGIAVTSAAPANAVPVAEYTRAAILLARKRAFTAAAKYLVDGFPTQKDGTEWGYSGTTIGVVGGSLIGKLVLELLRGYDMELLLADPFKTDEEARELGATRVSLEELCRRSDVVSIHAPALPSTHHLIDENHLSLMRDGAVLINTARGSLVDHDALVDHCRAGRIDAVLDVTDPEPLPANHPLLLLPNVTVTPHLAGAIGSEVATLGDYAVEETRRFFAGEPLRNQIRIGDLSTVA
jgi:phosphoglycerate dehydrogenase-like enzyme